MIKWFYGDFEIVSRIPDEVGEFWAKGYGIVLGRWQAIKAPSHFNGQHMGRGFGPELLLARDEAGHYLLLKAKT